MSKALTIDAIEASATEIFARHGYDGSSLREIANHAGVSLSAIHQYFESKSDLYVHIGKLLFERLNAQREDRLAEIKSSGAAIDLEAVIYCLIAPVVLSRASRENAMTLAQLRTWHNTTAHLGNHPDFTEDLRKSTTQWAELICAHCHGLDFEGGLFAFTMVMAAILNWDATSDYVSETLHMKTRGAPEDECERLARLISAGIRALAAR